MNELQALRRDFDDVFARPASGERRDVEQYLVMRTGERLLAMRIQELRGVRPGTRLTPLPGSDAGCLGLALVDGRIVRVQTLGCDEPKWLVLRGGVALAVDELWEVVAAPRDADWVPTSKGRVERVDARVVFEGENT